MKEANMKNFLKKMNRGVIVSCVIIIALVIYLLVDNAMTNKAKPVVKELAISYITASADWIPHEADVDLKDFSNVEDIFESIYARCSESDSELFSENSYIQTTAVSWLLDAETHYSAEDTYQITDVNCEVVSISKVHVYNKQATVNCKVTTEFTYIINATGEIATASFDTDETVSCIEENDKWVVSSYTGTNLMQLGMSLGENGIEVSY